jgi:glycosyltransferase involved in cell wall biosynthesis
MISSSAKHRFLYVVGSLHVGGLERQLYYLLRALDRVLYDSIVVTWNHHEDDRHVRLVRALGVPIYPVTSQSRIHKLKYFRSLVNKLRPEVVHSYSFYTNIAAYWGTAGSYAITLGSIRSNFDFDKESAGTWLGNLSARWPYDQICNSHVAVENARRTRSPFVPKRLYVVRNGIDLELFRATPIHNSDKIRITGLGNLIAAKRWDRLLVLASELKRRQINFVVRIAGDGPLRQNLKHMTEFLGLTDEVQFLGRINDISTLLADSTFVIHTADSEGCPNAIMEAMASARAVIATDAGDIPDLVREGKTGFVVNRQDPASLLERTLELVRNPELCRIMGERGRLRAEQEFSLDRLVKNTLDAYRAAGWNGS